MSVHKKRSDLTYCHRSVDEVVSTGQQVNTRWIGVTCPKCRSFRHLKRARDRAEKEYWDKIKVKEDKKKFRDNLKEKIKSTPIHGKSFDNNYKTFCGVDITIETFLHNFPRITCPDCLSIRRDIKKADELLYGED